MFMKVDVEVVIIFVKVLGFIFIMLFFIYIVSFLFVFLSKCLIVFKMNVLFFNNSIERGL